MAHSKVDHLHDSLKSPVPCILLHVSQVDSLPDRQSVLNAGIRGAFFAAEVRPDESAGLHCLVAEPGLRQAEGDCSSTFELIKSWSINAYLICPAATPALCSSRCIPVSISLPCLLQTPIKSLRRDDAWV